MGRNNSLASSLLAITCFLICALLGSLLLLVAGVMGLGDLLGSLLLAFFVLGLIFVVIAVVLYQCSLRAKVEELSRQINTIYEVAAAAQSGYRWASDRISCWLDKM